MKGIILAGGYGTRLMPCTRVTNKHLLPVFNKPMIMYPLQTLINCGIKEIMIVSGRGHAGHFLELLGSGEEFGVKLSYAIQERAGGIAEALGITEDFSDNDDVCVILGDNIFFDNFKKPISLFKEGATIFLKEVPDVHRFATVEVKETKIIGIVEKPKNPKSNLAATGLYIFDKNVYNVIKTLKPSNRGELEITDVLNDYLKKQTLKYEVLTGFWSDAGTFESLFKASQFIRNEKKKA